jgi:hypothetical protein
MATEQPTTGTVQLRYGSAKVFEQADTRGRELGELTQGDSFSVVSAEGEYYQVKLADGTIGYVYAHNLTGSSLPATAVQQADADRRAANTARDAEGWRGSVKRRFGR